MEDIKQQRTTTTSDGDSKSKSRTPKSKDITVVTAGSTYVSGRGHEKLGTNVDKKKAKLAKKTHNRAKK